MTKLKSRIGRVVIRMLPVNPRTFDGPRHELRGLRVGLSTPATPSTTPTISRDPGPWRELGSHIMRLPPDIFTPVHVINYIFHQSGDIFSPTSSRRRQAAFEGVDRARFRRFDDAALPSDEEEHGPYSLNVEAVE